MMRGSADSLAAAGPLASPSIISEGSTVASGERRNLASPLPRDGAMSKTAWNLGLVGVGCLKTQEVLASFYARLTSGEKKELAALFSSVLRTTSFTATASARRRIDPEKGGGVLFVSVDSTCSFLFCSYFKDELYPERVAFALLAEVEQLVRQEAAQAPSPSLKGGVLEKRLREPMRRLLARYNSPAKCDKTTEVLLKADEVKIQVRDTIHKMLRNHEGLEDLTAKTEGLSSSARAFHQTAADAKRTLYWRDVRTIVVAVFFLLLSVGLLAYIVIHFFIK